MPTSPEPYSPRTTFSPGESYALLKRKLTELKGSARPEDAKALSTSRMLDASSAALGANSVHHLNAMLDRLVQEDVRTVPKSTAVTTPETPVLQLMEILSLDLTDAANATDADWLFLECFLQKLAKRLGLLPGNLCNAAAQAWCCASTWSVVQSRVLQRRTGLPPKAKATPHK